MKKNAARVSKKSDLETGDASNRTQRLEESDPEALKSQTDLGYPEDTALTNIPSNPGSSRVLRSSTLSQRVGKLISTDWNDLTFLLI